jgi:pilus assembly protein CpaC
MRTTLKTFFLALIFLPLFAQAAELAPELVNVEINKGQMVKFSRSAASVVVADPTTADIQVVSPKMVFVYGKKIGETSLTAVDDKDEMIFNGVVEVSHNLSSLERQVKRVAPKSHITFKTVDGWLLIDGSANSVQEAENIKNLAVAFVGDKDKVVNMMTTRGSDQVMLKVKIVEMARNDLKNLGVNLSASVSGGGIVSQVVNGPLSTAAVIGRDIGADGNILTKITSGKNSISGLIDALETDGLATVLAEPSLTTSTGKSASFLAGGQYPIPVAGQNGTVTVQYEPFGVSLNFTPVVMSNERLSILVNPEVSTLNFSNPIQVAGFTYPILDTRKAQATVELGSGQTFVLAGLLRNDTSNNISKFPGMGDLPVLGELFRSQKFQNNQTELVILVTPYIVHPVSNAKKVQTPLDGFKPPSDMERIAMGSLYQQQDMPEEQAKEIAPTEKKKKTSAQKLSVKNGSIVE